MAQIFSYVTCTFEATLPNTANDLYGGGGK